MKNVTYYNLIQKTIAARLLIALFSACSFFTFHFQAYADPAVFKMVTLEYAPSAFTDENGNVIGIHVDIAKEALKRMGLKYEIIIMPWKRALKTVYEGNADGIVDPAYNEERGRYCHFPKEASHVDQWCLFQKKGRNIRISNDMSNIRTLSIGIAESFEYGGELQAALNEKRFRRIERVTDENLLLKMLTKGRFDILPGEKSNILYSAKKIGVAGEIETVKSPETGDDLIISNSPTYIAFSKKRVPIDFVNQFSHVIAEMKKDGAYDRIRNNYLK